MDILTNEGTFLEVAPANPRTAIHPAGRESFLGWLRRSVTALIVFASIAGLLVWGHHTGWKLPSFAALTGHASEGKDDWCDQHSVPESECVECNPDLMPRPKSYGWCKQHGVHECPLCHPEVAQTPTRARVTSDDLARAQRALDFFQRPENNSKCKLHERRIQFVSQEAVDKAGVEVEPVWKAPAVEFITGSGEINYDQTHTARLSARVSGTVFRTFKQVGDPVQPGELVALVDAAEVGRAKSEFLHALVQARLKATVLANLKKLTMKGAVPERSVLEADTALSEVQIRLATAQQALTNLGLPVQAAGFEKVPEEELPDRIRLLGLPTGLADSFDQKTITGNLLPLTAPFEGVVVSRDVVAGEVVDVNKVLFVVVDTRQVWLTLDLRQEDAKFIQLGQKVRFKPDSAKDEAAGTISWVSTEADHKTRTIKVRVILDNARGRLRANTFGVGKVVLREEPQAIVVPNTAVHWEGDCYVVFVRDKNFLKPDAPKVFHTRTVRVGVKDDKNTEIIAGVLPGELVATRGSATLRAELLRGNLGDG
jgi:cobalt-zinc-cadmium efflux system membrane fusion protein